MTAQAEIDVASLGRTILTDTFAALSGFGRGTLYTAAKEDGYIEIGDEIVRPIRVRRAVRWPTAPILRGLGLDPESSTGPADGSPDEAVRDEHSTAGAA